MTPDPARPVRGALSSTTVPPRRWTVGPLCMAVLPAVTTVIPLFPLSEEPMASVMRRWGSRAKNRSFTGDENSAADDTTATSDERSWCAPGSSSDSTSGLPMASPVIMTELTRSSPTSRQTWWGSNLAIRTMREPTKLWPITPTGSPRA